MTFRRPTNDPVTESSASLLTRRRFISNTMRVAAVTGILSRDGFTAFPTALGADDKPLKIAAVLTEFTFRSHAHVLLENFLESYLFNGRLTSAGMSLASLYVDQFPDKDMARDVAVRYGIPIYPSIREALCLGGNTLAVDGVLIIGEHGRYPVNEKGQHEYPRKRFFDEVIAVFQQSGRVAPVFNDKHLSYRWDWAKEMYDTARNLQAPFMAGSSVPLAERRPPLEIRPNARITEAVSIHAGPIESYDFHGLEVLQSMVESRRGGETGVTQVQFLEGEALWESARNGEWSPELAQAALDTDPPVVGVGSGALIRPPTAGDTSNPFVHHGILIRYRDGLRAIVLGVTGGGGIKWQFGCRIEGESKPLTTSFRVGPWNNRNLFKALAHAIQAHYRDRQAPYPVERTLLTTGILAAAMDSRFENGKALETPQLGFAYQPRDFREMRETGASWKIITEVVPEPKGIDPLGDARKRVSPSTPGPAGTKTHP